MKSASTDFLKLHARLNQALNEKGFEIIKQQAYMIRPKAPGKNVREAGQAGGRLITA